MIHFPVCVTVTLVLPTTVNKDVKIRFILTLDHEAKLPQVHTMSKIEVTNHIADYGLRGYGYVSHQVIKLD